MLDSNNDAVSVVPPRPRPVQAGRTVHAFGRAFATVGGALALVLAFVFPAFLFRADAARDMRVIIAAAFGAAWLGGFVAAAWVQAFPDRRAYRRGRVRVPAWRLRTLAARVRLVALLLVPFA